ncbi:precorrin-6y C5,15-methyltransferase (decarboxylating) subunit CbiE [Natranaerobius trueperi]|uniref:Tetrapyrrole methylase domain-containing protein n=1 Tax=Natranaerobius trueperi TaxID=759412 RepID=A0A226BXY1_9FIRM|nr:precorrin-6y C5,15-methyltransferase (decarboxylating) subunit CbiE [Natranaerobius trueperi]OWZ82977.1 hypothetical protein CDO51_11120 [Natranaerobius trueperi]
MGKIVVVGMGPGTLDYIIPKAKQYILNADLLVGTKNQFNLVEKIDPIKGEQFDIKDGIDSSFEKIKKSLDENKRVTVMVSGDPGFYSLFSLIKRTFPNEDILVIPGISSLQLAMARICESWEDVRSLSLHGRKHNLTKLLKLIKRHKKVAVLLGGEITTHYLKEYLSTHANEYKKRCVDVMADLASTNESIISTTVENLDNYPVYSNCVVYFRKSSDKENQNITSLEDSELTKENVAMTKEEVRAVIISKLRLFSGGILWDIGAGTGGISIHAERTMGEKGKVFAIEQSSRAIEVIKDNVSKLASERVSPIHGKAPDVLSDLPKPDRIVIGGSSGKLIEILIYIDGLANFNGLVVIPTVTLETLMEAINYFKENTRWNYQVQKLQVSRLDNVKHMSLWKGENPITIITAKRESLDE